MTEMRDEFLSEEDLDLVNLSEEELHHYWMLWLEWAQATNDADRDYYSHGVFAGHHVPTGADRTVDPDESAF